MQSVKTLAIGLLAAATLIYFGCAPSDRSTTGDREFTVDQVSLTNLMRTTLETVDGAEVMVSIVELPPDTVLPRHYHPGEEFVYVMDGSATLWQQGKPDTVLAKGAVYKVPFEQEHTAMTGDESARVLVFRVHRQGEPERILTDGE